MLPLFTIGVKVSHFSVVVSMLVAVAVSVHVLVFEHSARGMMLRDVI
jgi:hypothetical protein